MKKQQFQPLTPAALYARVSSDRQDVDLSVAAQMRALRDYAKSNGYSVAREYVDEAESGRIADRPQFRKMIDEGGRATAPFEVILVWKFSRFTRKREHAVAFKSMLRRKGIRVVSITEHADDSPTGKLMEAIIESVDEFYSENLAEEVKRGMREAASRGFFLGSRAPFGYRRIKVSDGVKDRPTLEVDPVAAPIVKEIFESSRRGNGLKEICKELNNGGITHKGRRWQKNVVHYLLTNEAYTGTAVWGVKSKDEKNPDPVRVEDAWPALVSRELFDEVQKGLHERAPTVARPGRVGSQYLLSGLLRCGVCGKPYSAQGAKSGQFAYYVCASLFREGAGACSNGRYLNANKVEDLVIEKVRERILTEETITELVTLVAEEIDNIAGEVNGRLTAISAELSDVDSRLENLYQALETRQLPLEVLSPRILALKSRQDQLTAAREEAEDQLDRRRAELPTSKEIRGYVADFRELFQEGTFPERKALIRNFVQAIEIVDDQAELTYTIPMPQDGITSESAPVLDFVQSGPPLAGFQVQNWRLLAPGCHPCMTVKKVSDLSSAAGFGPDSDLSLREAGRRFINSYRAAGYSRSYVKSLEETIGYLAHFSEERGWPPISQITTQHMEEYFAYSRTRLKGYGERKITGDETLSSSYLDKQFRQLSRFWACMVEAKWAPVCENVLDDMRRPRVVENIVPTVSNDQIADLLSLVDPRLARTRLDTFRLKRNNAVIQLFVDTPVRRSEIATMKVADVILEEEKIQVMGKGRRQRFMPIGRAAQRALGEYLDARDIVYPVSEDLWVSESGEAMEPDWIYQLIKRLRERANIPRLHPHMFRHTYAINALRSGMPEQILKIIGGWRKIPETYFRTLGYEDAAAFHRTMSPGDRVIRQAPARKKGERKQGGPRARGEL